MLNRPTAFIAPGGDVIHGEFAAAHGFRGFRDRGLALRRTVLDAILLGRARAAGAHVVEGERVESLLFDARGAQWASPYGLIAILTAVFFVAGD